MHHPPSDLNCGSEFTGAEAGFIDYAYVTRCTDGTVIFWNKNALTGNGCSTPGAIAITFDDIPDVLGLTDDLSTPENEVEETVNWINQNCPVADAIQEHLNTSENPYSNQRINNILNDLMNGLDVTPPSCESFVFSQVTSNYQAAAVRDIGFDIRYIVPNQGLNELVHIEYPQPIYFGTPSTYYNGETLAPNEASNRAVRALDRAMRGTKDYLKIYYPVTEAELRLKFEEKLLFEYQSVFPGGTVQFNYAGPVPSTIYLSTYLFIDDGC